MFKPNSKTSDLKSSTKSYLNLSYFQSSSNLVWKYLKLFDLNSKLWIKIWKPISIYLYAAQVISDHWTLAAQSGPCSLCFYFQFLPAHLVPSPLGLFQPSSARYPSLPPLAVATNSSHHPRAACLWPPFELPCRLCFLSRSRPSGSPPLGAVLKIETVSPLKFPKSMPVTAWPLAPHLLLSFLGHIKGATAAVVVRYSSHHDEDWYSGYHPTWTRKA
jgi:hypothetical protein